MKTKAKANGNANANANATIKATRTHQQLDKDLAEFVHNLNLSFGIQVKKEALVSIAGSILMERVQDQIGEYFGEFNLQELLYICNHTLSVRTDLSKDVVRDSKIKTTLN